MNSNGNYVDGESPISRGELVAAVYWRIDVIDEEVRRQLAAPGLTQMQKLQITDAAVNAQDALRWVLRWLGSQNAGAGQ